MLVPGHVDELRKSGLNDETIASAGLYSAPAAQVHELLGYGTGSAGLVFPYPPVNGSGEYVRVKLDHAPSDQAGKVKRYRAPARRPVRLYIPPLVDAKILADPSMPLWITEGEKKALKACQEGLACVALSGVDSWRTRWAEPRDIRAQVAASKAKARGQRDTSSTPIEDLEHIVWRGRTVYICFDSDLATNERVRRAEIAFAGELRGRGARVLAVRLPGGPAGEKVGLDDYLVTHSVETLCSIEPVEIAAPTSAGASAILVKLSDVIAEAVEWHWPGRLARGKFHAVIGDPGLGKSTLVLDVAAHLSVGRPWPDGTPCPQGASVILTAEDGLADTVRPRVDQLGGDVTRISVLRAVRRAEGEAPFSLAQDLAILEAAIRETGAIFVGIDPVSAYIGDVDAYRDSELRGAILAPLAALAERTRVAIVGVLHLTKDQQRAVLYRAQGSIAWVGQARIVHIVTKDRDVPGRRLFVTMKSNLAAEPPALAYRLGGAGCLSWEPAPVPGTAEALVDADEVLTRSDRRDREQAKTFLRDLLSGGPVSSKQVSADAKANGIAERTLWRAKSELGVQAERATSASGKPAGWYWFIPADPANDVKAAKGVAG